MSDERRRIKPFDRVAIAEVAREGFVLEAGKDDKGFLAVHVLTDDYEIFVCDPEQLAPLERDESQTEEFNPRGSKPVRIYAHETNRFVWLHMARFHNLWAKDLAKNPGLEMPIGAKAQPEYWNYYQQGVKAEVAIVKDIRTLNAPVQQGALFGV